MKTKTILLIFIPVLALCFALGAAGVLKIDSRAESQTEDKLVGVFLTSEHLDMPDFEDRIYAEGEDFIGLNGLRCFFSLQEDEEGSYYKTTADNGASDRSIHFTSTDEGEKIEQELTVYLESRRGTWTMFINPVYQTGEGLVYVQTGQGIRAPAETAGESASSTRSEEYTYTDGTQTKTDGSFIKVTVQVVDRPETVKILEFDGENALICEQAYGADEVPMSYKPGAETKYIVIELVSKDINGDQSTQRRLYQATDEYFETFYSADDGICVKRETELNW